MNITLRRALPLLALPLALVACQKKAAAPSTDPMAENVAAPATPVELPPAITSTKSYRCKDNSVVYVDLFQGDKQANLRTEATGSSTVLKGEAGKPLIAEGYELVTKGAGTISVTRPGHAKQDCTT